MKKNILFTITFCLVTSFAFSQTNNCDQLKKDLADSSQKLTKIEAVNNQLLDSMVNLKKENDYFRESLHILTPIKSALTHQVKINILSCIGNKQDQTITLLLTFVNGDVNKTIQFQNSGFGKGKQLAVDVQGNSYNTDNVQCGQSKYSSEILTNVPVKATVIFEGIPSSVLMLKVVKFYMILSDNHSVPATIEPQFSDLAVKWE